MKYFKKEKNGHIELKTVEITGITKKMTLLKETIMGICFL